MASSQRPTAEAPDRSAQAVPFRFRLTPAYAALLSLGLLPAYLALPFASSELFCGFALMAMSVLLLAAARRRLTVFGLILPAYLGVLFTGSFAVQTGVIGVIFAASVTAFLIRGGRWPFAVIPLAASVALVGTARGFGYAVLLLLPVAAAAALSVLWCRTGFSGAVTAVAAALAAAFAILFFIDGRMHLFFSPDVTGAGDLSAVAASLRDALAARFNAIQTAAVGFADEKSSASAAEKIVNLLPAALFSAALLLGYLQSRVLEAFAANAGLGERIPPVSRELSLSPVCGFAVLTACFLCLCTGLGGTKSFMSALAVNLICILLLPLCAVGTRALHRFLSVRLFGAEDPERCTAAYLVVAALILFTSALYLVCSACAGLALSLAPVTERLRRRIGGSGGEN